MKILFITEYFPKTTLLDVQGGVEARTYNISAFMAKRHHLYVLASHEKNKPKEQELNNIYIKRVGFIRDYIPSSGHVFIRIVLTLAFIWNGFFIDFDIVEGTGLVGWLPAFILSVLKRKKRVVFVPDFIEDYTLDNNFFENAVLILLQRFLLRRKWDKIICISKVVKKKLLSLGMSAKMMSVIYCGADIRTVDSLEVTKRKFPTICCVSRLVSYKRVHDLVEAISMLKDIKNIRLDIVGVGEELLKLKQLTKRGQLLRNVVFHGFVDNHNEVISIMKRAHIFCIPSIIEGFGIATIEAMAGQVPVILADIPINHEITTNKGALFFEPGNSRDLSNKINLLLTNRRLYQKLKRETRLVALKYDWKNIGQQTERIYENLYAD